MTAGDTQDVSRLRHLGKSRITVPFQVVLCNRRGRRQHVVPLINNANFVVDESKLEQRDAIIRQKLRENGTTFQRRELLRAAAHILLGLHNRQLIMAALCLNRNNVLRSSSINSNIDFVDLDLTHPGHCREAWD